MKTKEFLFQTKYTHVIANANEDLQPIRHAATNVTNAPSRKTTRYDHFFRKPFKVNFYIDLDHFSFLNWRIHGEECVNSTTPILIALSFTMSVTTVDLLSDGRHILLCFEPGFDF